MRKIIIIILGLFFGGCAGALPPPVQPHQVNNVALDPVTGRNIRSIAVFPLYDPQEMEGVGERLSELISLNILKIGRFKVVEPTVVKNILEQKRLSAASGLTIEEMLKIGREMGVDAVIYGQVIAYRPYQYFPEKYLEREAPAIVGLHLKMLTGKNNNLVWAASDTFNGADEAIALLVPSEERWKVKVDIDFLSTLLIGELTKTLNY